MALSEIAIQDLVEPWWEETTSKIPEPGMLDWAFEPIVDQAPYTFHPVGRREPRKHQEATVRIERLKIEKSYSTNPPLPVAAMSLAKREVWSAFRAKKRPCLILSGASANEIDRHLTVNQPKASYAATVILAPYYGADQGSRVGYPPHFLERIRSAEYSQFFADKLPINSKTKESVLRFDHLQPVGFSQNSFELTGYKLSDAALEVMDDWLHWRLWGGIPEKSGSEHEHALEAFWELVNEE
jgi:hypothetical protein